MDVMNTKIAHRFIDLHINASIKTTRFSQAELFGHTLTTLGRSIVFIVQIRVTQSVLTLIFSWKEKGILSVGIRLSGMKVEISVGFLARDAMRDWACTQALPSAGPPSLFWCLVLHLQLDP